MSVVELTMEMDKVILDLPVKLENARKVLNVLYDEPIISRKKILEYYQKCKTIYREENLKGDKNEN